MKKQVCSAGDYESPLASFKLVALIICLHSEPQSKSIKKYHKLNLCNYYIAWQCYDKYSKIPLKLIKLNGIRENNYSYTLSEESYRLDTDCN